MDEFGQAWLDELEAHVLKMAGITVGSSCKKKAFKVGKKAVAYIGEGKGSVAEVMLKLQSSLGQAEELQRAQPRACKVGKGGWVTLRLEDEQNLEVELVKSWLNESEGIARGT